MQVVHAEYRGGGDDQTFAAQVEEVALDAVLDARRRVQLPVDRVHLGHAATVVCVYWKGEV